MDIFAQLADRIIKEQETIIGPIAYEQASKVSGLTVDPTTQEVSLQGNKKEILEHLVKQYEHLFGRTSVEVCKEAVKDIISKAPREQMPPVLL